MADTPTITLRLICHLDDESHIQFDPCFVCCPISLRKAHDFSERVCPAFWNGAVAMYDDHDTSVNYDVPKLLRCKNERIRTVHIVYVLLYEYYFSKHVGATFGFYG
jgi:hypothetical protein